MKILKGIITTLLTITVLLASWALLFIFLFGSKFIELSLIGNKEITVNIDNDYFENGYVCKLLNFDLTKKVTVDNHVNVNETGDYIVNYRIKYLFYNKEITRKVTVIDTAAPILTLTGDTTVYVVQYGKYVEPGYKAVDAHEGDITDRVEITGNVNLKKIGKYKIQYKVSDLSGNSVEAEREVEVIKSGVLNQPIERFWLKGLFTDVILEPDKKNYDYLKDAVFVGDSNIKYLYTHGKYLEAKQVWAKNNLTAVDINTTKVTIHKNNKEMTIDEALTAYKPKYLIVSFGMRSAFLTKDAFVNNASKFMLNIKNNHPETKLIILSIPPVTIGSTSPDTQTRLNKVNYYAAQLCSRYKIGYINIADQLRGSDGYGKQEYLLCEDEEDCGFHLTNSAKKFVVNYIKKINLEKEI